MTTAPTLKRDELILRHNKANTGLGEDAPFIYNFKTDVISVLGREISGEELARYADKLRSIRIREGIVPDPTLPRTDGLVGLSMDADAIAKAADDLKWRSILRHYSEGMDEDQKNKLTIALASAREAVEAIR